MLYKKKKKKADPLFKASLGIVGGSAVMSVGSQALGNIGGASALHGQSALSTLSRYQPITAKITGAGMALKSLEGFGKPKKKRLY